MGFTALDDLLLQSGYHGNFLVRLADRAQFDSVCRHIARRVKSGKSRRSAVIPTAPNQSLWREAAYRLGQPQVSSDTEETAQNLTSLLHQEEALIAGRLVPGTLWDWEVAELLQRLEQGRRGSILLLLLPGDPYPSTWKAPVYELESILKEEGLARWWAALCAEGLQRSQQETVPKLEILEQTWGQTLLRAGMLIESNSHPIKQRFQVLSEEDRRAVQRLQLAGRPWFLQQMKGLGFKAESLRRLLDAELLLQGEGGLVRASEELEEAPRERSEVLFVAQALQREFPEDPWSQEQAATLFVQGGDLRAAEDAHFQAIRHAKDAFACSDLWGRWAKIIENIPQIERHRCYLHCANIALSRGDTDSALMWAEHAVALRSQDHSSQVILGRALLGRGDLVGADLAISQAIQAACCEEEEAAAQTYRAEIRYAQGRIEEAEQLAQEAISRAPEAPSVLAARNTLGKLLLARGLWGQAEEHFASDAVLATRFQDHSAQLRARLNRAIAVMSSSRYHEARPMLEAVLEEGRLLGDDRAAAFALSNLSVLAMNHHEYGEALQLSEQAIHLRRRMGERLGLARIIANLAELRLRLGLLDEAQQTLSFGRLTISRGTNIPRNAHFSLISARIHLARGHTLPATRELSVALAGANGSSDGDMLSECFRVGVRVALEEGDTERARQELEQAEQQATTPYAQAEISLLRAYWLRTVGQPCLDAAQQAVHLARRAGDEEFLREAHTLSAQIARSEELFDQARSHLHQAIVLRDHVLSGLPELLRKAFLARRDLIELTRLERDLAPSVPTVVNEEVPRSRPSPGSTSRLLTGESAAIRSLLEDIRKVGRTNATVLVLGESGTGKELVAEALHDASLRQGAPLVRVNCGALVESLLLSELFGHEKGAFTGAVARKRGRFELAEGGTLFLDEIGDISPATQVALLRVLQERTFERVGGTTSIRANVRIVCATHRDLKTMVDRGEFRQDLYFRLSGITLHVPSLRTRLGDLPTLVRHLLQRIAIEREEPCKSLSPDALSLLTRHRWPGNVRELENALRAASLFAEGTVVEASDFTEHVEALRPLASHAEAAPISIPPRSQMCGPPSSEHGEFSEEEEMISQEGVTSDATETIYSELKAGKFGLFDIKRQLERDCIARALAETRGNITRAAAILGMKRPRLSQLVKQYGLASVSSEGS